MWVWLLRAKSYKKQAYREKSTKQISFLYLIKNDMILWTNLHAIEILQLLEEYNLRHKFLQIIVSASIVVSYL